MRDLIATWRENEELIRLGAYRLGTDPKVDQAIAMKRTGLAETILSHVPRTKKYRREIERIERRIQPKKSLDDWNQIQKVKTLLEQDMVEAARIQRSNIASRYNQEPDVVWIDEQLNNAVIHSASTANKKSK